jgi:uncharacterized protein
MLSLETLKGSPLSAKFNVSALLQQPVGTTLVLSISSLLGRGQEELVSGTIRFTHTGRGIALSGEGAADVALTCMRCLDEYPEHVVFVIEEQVHPDPHFAHRRGAEGFEEDDEVHITADNTLDLGEILRQHIVLHLPLKPLCRVDCPGLKETSPDV